MAQYWETCPSAAPTTAEKDKSAVTINTLYSADAPIPRMFSSLLVL